MSVISRSALESSSLADLHEISSELGLDGYRRLRKADLIAAIIERQGGDLEQVPADGDSVDAPASGNGAAAEASERPARRSRRGGRGRRARDRDPGDIEVGEEEPDDDAPLRSGRTPRGGRSERADRSERGDEGDERIAAGTVELLPNGSGFVRVSPPEPSDDDVYVSAAQVRRCELVAGDEVSGPVRRPRRSERYPSLIRVDTINGRAADEVAEGTKYEDLPCAYASERIALGGDDPTLRAVEWLTPFGRGSRVVITGGAGAGKSRALRLLAATLAERDELECSIVLVGVRPEELAGWGDGPLAPAVQLSLAAAVDAQAQALERAVETGRRVAARGGHALVLIDTLDYLPAPLARRALAAARNIVDGGSLTIVATASEPLGGETTVIALDAALAASGITPALDLAASSTICAELLVGEQGAAAIVAARAATIAGTPVAPPAGAPAPQAAAGDGDPAPPAAEKPAKPAPKPRKPRARKPAKPKQPAAAAAPEPAAATSADEPAAATSADEPAAATSADEPAAATSADEPAAATSPDEPAAATSPDEPAATTSPDEPAAATSADEPAATTSPDEPAATPTGGEPADE